MAKFLGIILIASSILSLIAGAYIDAEYGNNSRITGNAITNILIQPPIPMGLFDYVSGAAFSYSIISFIVGSVFLFKIS